MSRSPTTHHSPIRSISRDGHGPLRHPTPDLQSLQGAYVGNVERLEESAERLSLISNIGEELRKLHTELKCSESRKSSAQAASRQLSTSSFTNSILGVNSIARSGGFSPEGYVTSPIGSMLSPPWSHRSFHDQKSPSMDELPPRYEPQQEGRPLDSPISPKPAALTVTNPGLMESPEEEKDAFDLQETCNGMQEGLERPASAGSGDTFQRATNAFADFDGVHIEADTRPEEQELHEPVEAVEPTSPHESSRGIPSPRPRDDMVFYPAPVPMMLSLPQKLSKAPDAAKVAQRKQEVLAAPSAKARKSVLRLGDMRDGAVESQSNPDAANDASRLPPQLRATMFFDHAPVHQDIQITGGSAVATLDTILDASAHAPVSAFTDHPFAGQAGAEIYGKSSAFGEAGRASAPKRKSRSSMQLLANRKSSANVQKDGHRHSTSLGAREGIAEEPGADPYGNVLDADAEANHEGTPLRQSMEHEIQEDVEDEQAEFDDNDEDRPDLEGEAFYERPTTLLAELQLRKQQQQRRNRTAATAFPNGMHSTLLELDAVAQVQEKARKQKHVLLAWEDPDDSHPADKDPDEDVPLGVLYPSSKPSQKNVGRFDDNRPLGLLAQRAMEDNEPLSQRRARLRGEPIRPPYSNHERSQSAFNLQAAGPSRADREGESPEDEEEGETLAQRLRRLRGGKPATNNRKSISSDFASELLSQFGGPKDSTDDPKAGADNAGSRNKTPDLEETLGQRRARLQAERSAQSRNVSGETASEQQRPAVQKRRSMADILQAHPVGALPHQPPGQASVPGISPSGLVGGIGSERQASMNRRRGTGVASPMGQTPRQGPPLAAAMPHFPAPGHPAASYVNPMSFAPVMDMNGMATAPGYAGMAPGSMAEPMPLDRKQRDMIDRWRQSVM